jgi:hypothetical protein
MSGQLHAPAVLSPVPIRLEAVWVPEPVWTTWKKGKFLSLPGLELRPLGRPASSQCIAGPYGYYVFITVVSVSETSLSIVSSRDNDFEGYVISGKSFNFA